jgi:hypothetical protein
VEQLARVAGRDDFHAAVRATLAEAAAEGWRGLWLCDPDFADWPLGEAGVIESLTQWAGAERRLTLLALHYDEIARRHPRWVLWRRLWAHRVRCRALPELQPDDVPVMLHAAGALTLRLLDPSRFRGTISRQASEGVRARGLIDAISQRSIEAFPASTLGL